MALEWLRRTDPTLARHLKTFLFTEGPITGIEAVAIHGGGEEGESPEASPAGGDGSLGIGSLRKAGGGK